MASPGASRFDVRAAEYPDPYELGARIVDRIAYTGYCILDLCSEDLAQAIDKATIEANEWKRKGRFVIPPHEVVDALLGDEGSTWILKLDRPGEGGEPEDEGQGSGIKKVNQVLSELGKLLEESVPALGFEMGMRTDAIIHEAGATDKRPPILKAKEAQVWLHDVTWHRLMCMVFLGPGRYSLQMQPFYDEGAAQEVYVDPGSVVLLRPDVLSHTAVNALADARVMTCWYLSSHRNGAMWGGTTVQPTPTASKLSLWLETQIQLFMDQEDQTCPLTAYRVLEKGVMKMDNPHPSANMVDIMRQGDIVRGVIKQVRRDDYWLEMASEEDGEPRSVWMPTVGNTIGLGTLLERLPVEAWRVIEKVVFRLRQPRPDAQPVGMVKQDEIVRGYSSILPDGSLWLNTIFVDDDGFWTESWMAVNGAQVGLGTMLEKVAEDNVYAVDLSREMKIKRDHMYSQSLTVCVRTHAARVPTSFDSDSFFAMLAPGLDAATAIPIRRFGSAERFNPDPDSIDWENDPQFTCKHCCFIDGVELFDHKCFSLPIAEASTMAPNQRIILEITRECLRNAGLADKEVLKQPWGVYVGGGTPEFMMIPKETVPGGEMYQTTGGSGAIYANRVSYALGLMGPSIMFECEMASSHVAMETSYTSLNRTKPANPRCLCIGEYLNIADFVHFALARQGGGLSTHDTHARCRAFDDTAKGYIRADSLISFFLSPLIEEVDGQDVKVDEEYSGLIVSSCCGHVGPYAQLHCPSAAADMDLMGETIRRAKIEAVSIDLVECHAEGRVLNDASESMASLNLLRVKEGASDYPLSISAVKSQLGNANHGAGMEVFLKTIHCQRYGTMLPLLHLFRLNPNIDVDIHPGLILVEPLRFGSRSSIVFSNGRSESGTLGQTIFCGHADEGLTPQGQWLQPVPIKFWTGGGGELDYTAGGVYEIAGSFNGWRGSVPMKNDGNGVFSYTMTLGVNGFEQFQIWLDGNPRRALHPGRSKAEKEVTVLGPDEDVRWNTWIIDGRASYIPADPSEQYASSSGEASLEDVSGDAVEDPPGDDAYVDDAWSVQYVEVPNADAGKPGDLYRVQLQVSGKWRAVTWEKLLTCTETLALADGSQAAGDGCIDDKGAYFVVGSWNTWTFRDPMAPSGFEPGLHSVEVCLTRRGGEFQIVRDRDWTQVMYPESGLGPEDTVAGPDDADEGLHWSIGGKAGDVFRIDFRRTYDGEDHKLVNWEFVRHEPLTHEVVQAAKRNAYAIVGSWDGWEKDVMQWDGNKYKFRVDVGPTGREHFQILLEGEWAAQYRPSVDDANPYEPHHIVGPGPEGDETLADPLYWTIGSHELDGNAAGQTYEIELHVEYGGPFKVTWRRMDPVGSQGAE